MIQHSNLYVSLDHNSIIEIIREICDTEQQKFQMWGAYNERVQHILNWQFFENDDEF